ncbi:hypothetical protein [Sphingorhabdus sp. M41]|uniref:hypothetical protein n=1 Tax=Sphingorhabdus sp. M41 TaxID=1806885 RepID=UPI00078EF57C|nr:hypothetical protein [Sphingorhabdus sp. M41]AMO71204.1 hypothetical protein AZE99_04440 [Sphingorhabdus sp. M41]
MDQSRRLDQEEEEAAGIVTFALDLNRCEQQDAANGKGGDNIEKRSHGFVPYSNADHTSLFLRNLQAADGRIGSRFQLRTQLDVLHDMQLKIHFSRAKYALSL